MPYKSINLPLCVDCGKQVSAKNVARCRACYALTQRGKPGDFGFTPNSYQVEGEIAFLSLTNRLGEIVAETMVDADRLPDVLQYRWCFENGYARTSRVINGKNRSIFLHRLILGLEHGEPSCADHINRNGLDNRQANLRAVDTLTNARNRSKRPSSRYPGVWFDGKTKRWCAQNHQGGKAHWIGRFDTEDEAGAASLAWRTQHS